MTERNKVAVRIYGQEFIISGDSPRDQIIKIADYVDRKMHELNAAMPSGPVSAIAVLAAVNAGEDYFRAVRTVHELQAKNQQLEKDTQHYVQLWDEAKSNFRQYKDDAQIAIEHREETQKILNEKTAEYNELLKQFNEISERAEILQKKNESLFNRMEAQEDEKESCSAMIKEMEARCRELEASFFDLQMENIQLKGDLDRLKKIVEQDERENL